MDTDFNRRRWCRQAGQALLLVPVLALARPARAATNDTLRAQLHYQDRPKEAMECSNCVDFIAGATAQARGGCKRIPGDDQIAPAGYCDAWNTL
jgi:hypothetical protein